MTLSSDVKFKEKLTCGLKNDMRNSVNFHMSSQKSEIFYFYGHLNCQKYKGLQLKSMVELCVIMLKSDAKFEGKMNCGFKNDMKNLVKFHPSTQNSENLLFHRLILSKEYKVSAKKLQKSYVGWH